MATITNNFIRADGVYEQLAIVVESYGEPYSSPGFITTKARMTTSTGYLGLWTQTLREGVYSLTWRSQTSKTWNRVFFAVPDSTLTFPLDQLLLSSPDTITFQSAEFATFSTVAEMLASDARLWEQAQVTNYSDADGVFTIWVKSSDQTILPNGSDILTTAAGIVVIRIYVREATDGTVVSPGVTPYTVNLPVTVPSITDLRASMFSTPLVWVGDASSPTAWVKGTATMLDDGVNGVMNAAGVHYDRIRFE